MQGERSILDSFPDTIDLNQGSVSGSNSNAMDHSAVWDNLLNPVENRLPNYMLSSGETSVGCPSTSCHNARRFSGWDTGECSSGAQDHMYDDLCIGQGWSTSVSSCAIPDAMQEDQPEPSAVICSESGNSYGGNHVNGRALNMSNHCSRNAYLNSGYMDNGDNCWQGTSSRCYFPSRAEAHAGLSFGSSTKNPGASSSNSLYMTEDSDESGLSLGASGSSGKRKSLEGCPAQFYSGGSSSAHAQDENVMWHNGPGRLNTAGSFTTSPPMWPYSSQPEQMNPRIGVGLWGTSSEEVFPPSTTTGVENAARNVGGRLNAGHQEQDLFTFPLAGASLGSSSNQPSRSFASSVSSLLINSPYHPSQTHATHTPGYSGSTLPYSWNGSIDSQSGSSLHHFMSSRDMGAIFHDELNSRSNLRNSEDHPAAFTSFERQDSPSSSLALGSSHSSRSLLPSSRSGSGSSIRNHPTGWTADQNLTAHNQHGLTEHAPWTLFPPVDYGNQRGHFPVTPPESSSSMEAEMLSFSSRRRQHPSSRPALVMDEPSDVISGWRALAVDLEGRQRLIRQVRNAARRRDNWRAQDFAVFSPFINGAAELHDRHSDMRLDVDSMSYEELLALEERIGNVGTGLNEEIIMKSMKQRKYQLTGSSSNDEACCICREEYVAGDDIGTAACGHEFHTDCIKQWLLLKNLCPICKMTALET
ncbi:ubiquitin-protein ligase [Lithospermum erythrorhizon]|uniref:RING-type E3 ubiquitin transferase n=1 Tax=Lithospermum erythrorhizon TaxID=34254 RepID=A0AAV3NSM7_LITER